MERNFSGSDGSDGSDLTPDELNAQTEVLALVSTVVLDSIVRQGWVPRSVVEREVELFLPHFTTPRVLSARAERHNLTRPRVLALSDRAAEIMLTGIRSIPKPNIVERTIRSFRNIYG
jgi:hypothetical protein